MNIQQGVPLTIEDIASLPVHSMAARFPMWPPDRLQELAADITVNGLNIPIVIWRREMMLLDGRNRLAACQIASVMPGVEWYDGDDPRALIISRNIQTREMTASQKAMLLALEFPEADNKGGRGKTVDIFNGFDRGLLSRARLINSHAPDLATAVITGAIRFADALKAAEVNRSRAKSTEARLERLQEGAPDLARQVTEETLVLEEAEAAFAERNRQRAMAREKAKDAASNISFICAQMLAIKAAIDLGETIELDPAQVELAADAVRQLQGMVKQQEARKE